MNRRVGLLVASLITVVIATGAVVSGFTSRDGSTDASPTAVPPGGNGTPVAIRDFNFEPNSVTVAVGAAITWTNQDGFDHSIKADDGSFASSDLGNGQTFSATFATPGTFAYVCGIHQFMAGTVVVTE